MGSLFLALSIDRQIEQIGAIAGFAAILGLAVLSLLYFAQAREVRRLREWAGRAPERDAELQQRVADDAARRAAGGPATPAPGAPRPAGANVPATAAAQAAAKPATPGLPPAPGAKPATPGVPAPTGGAAAPATPGAPKPSTPGAPATPGQPAPPAAKPATPGTGAPATPPPGAPPAAGAPKPGVPGKAPTTPPPARPGAPAPAATAAGARPRRTVTVGSTPASATVPERDERDGGSRVGWRAIGATVLGVALIVVVLLVSGVLGGGDDEPSAGGSPATTPASTTSTTDQGATIPEPSDTSVAVLNGTTVTGLARQAADQLEARDYSVIRVTDAADQAQQTSQVAYSEGFNGSARRIARIVGIDASGIVPLDPSTRVVAGDDASVVVTMGADKAQ